VYYTHHIIPKHAGGTDDPSNLIKLTLEEHANAHKELFKKYGRWQDEVAYKAISGSIGKEEIIKLKQSLATKGKKQTKEHKEKLKKPKPKVVCRLIDKKEMCLGNFMNWNKNAGS